MQVAQQWNYGFGKAMKETLGLSITDTLVYRDGKKTEYYVNKKQQEIYIQGLYLLLADKNFIRGFHKKAQNRLERILITTKKELNQDLSLLNNHELLNLYQKFILPNTEEFYIYMWTVFNIGEPLSNVVLNHLKKKNSYQTKITEYLLSFSSPLKPNDVINERIDLLKLAILRKKLKSADFNRRLNNHVLKYRHIPMFDFDHTPYHEKQFTEELLQIKNPEKELKEIKKHFSMRGREFKTRLLRLKPDAKLRQLLVFMKENVFLRDYRDMIRQKLNIELRKFYLEIGSRLGLTIKQTATLTNSEIVEYIKSEKKFPKREILAREKFYLLIQKKDTVEIFSGNKARSKAKTELNVISHSRLKELNGVVGSIGRAKGKVQIVYTNRDLAKVKKGDVLVTAMTRQDFVPAIRKAVALITDEGSITCHAAIIARELEIPCIVATKHATRVLKDGDRVIVDASSEKGIIKICG